MADRLAASGLAAAASTSVPGVAAADAHAGIGSRVFAFVLDSFVLLAFTAVFATASFLQLYLRSDSGHHTASDGAIWTAVAVLMAAIPCWLLFNLVLSWKRSQTVGQYVVGLRAVREDGGPIGLLRVAVYWLALHPVLFHPLLAGFWALLAYVVLSLSSNTVLVIGAAAVALLCFVAPFVAFFSALADRSRRALHDHIAGMLVVRLD